MVNRIRISYPHGYNKGFGSVRCSVWTSEVDLKQPTKAKGCIDRNVLNIAIKMEKIIQIYKLINLSFFILNYFQFASIFDYRLSLSHHFYISYLLHYGVFNSISMPSNLLWLLQNLLSLSVTLNSLSPLFTVSLLHGYFFKLTIAC